MSKGPTPREIGFAEIEQAFRVVGVYRRKGGAETVIQVRWDGPKEFVLDAEGNVLKAPRGFARVYKPGRVVGVDAALQRQAEADARVAAEMRRSVDT